jgi:type IV pilus assembly protein PilW
VPIARYSYGYSLVELMIAASLSVLVVAAVVTVVTKATLLSSRIEQTGEIGENAQFLTRLLRYELSLAGFYGEMDFVVDTNADRPNICGSLSITDAIDALSYPVDGINAVQAGERLCGGEILLPGSDVLLIRRSLLAKRSPRLKLQPKQHYIQTSRDRFILNTGSKSADFSLTQKDDAKPLPIRVWQQTVYYVSQDNVFKRRRFLKGRYSPAEPLAEGIIDFQLVYGIQSSQKTNADNIKFVEFPASDQQWQNLRAVRFYFLLASTSQSAGNAGHRVYQYAGKTKSVPDDRQYDLFSGISIINNMAPKIVAFNVAP